MAPKSEKVTVAASIPRDLYAILAARARQELTGRSTIVRQALVAYLRDREREEVQS